MKSITDILSAAFKEIYVFHGKALDSVKFDTVETTVSGSPRQSYMLTNVEFTAIGDASVNINGFDIPNSMSVAPEIGSDYFIPNQENKYLTSVAFWMNSDFDRKNLANGLCYDNPQHAVMHTKALLGVDPNA